LSNLGSRCKTGIEVLDDDLGGGFPRGNIILVSGGPGVGKTTFSMQFLINGVKLDEKGVFFTATEPLSKLKEHQRVFNYYNEDLIKSGDISIVDLWNISNKLGLSPESYSFEEANILFEVIRDISKELGAKRLIVDSITSLCYRLQTREMIRDFIFKLGGSLSVLGCTTIMTSEIPPMVFQYSLYEIEEFIADGILYLGDIERSGDLIRTFQIIKMRGTSHGRAKYALNISTENGIELSPMFKSNF